MSGPMKVAEKFGLCLTHNRLKINHLDEVVKFYTSKLGMRELSQVTHKETDERVHFLGFSGEMGQKSNKAVTFFELVTPANKKVCQPKVNTGRDSVYWKVGVNLPDVDKAAEKLSANGVSMGPPSQFLDIGYLSHLQDPDSWTVELLQFYFEKNKKPHTDLPSHPLGQQPVFGMITLRVKDIAASLKFYRDTLGMKLLCKEDVSVYGFYLYFLAFTDDEPPSGDPGAVENREWTYQRPCTVIELQEFVHPPQDLHYQDIAADQAGFLGLGMGTTAIEALRAHLATQNITTTAIETSPVFEAASFSARDPDGIPVRFIQM